jgi:hypothetical protein
MIIEGKDDIRRYRQYNRKIKSWLVFGCDRNASKGE